MTTIKDQLRWLALQAQKHGKSFIAMDSDGLWYAYDRQPQYHKGNWHGGGEFVCLTPTIGRVSEQMFEVKNLLSDEQL